MDIQTFINNLKLKKIKDNQLQGKCPYCGDTPREHHLGINFNKTPIFHCFRCNTSGTLERLAKDFNLNYYLFYLYLRRYYNLLDINNYETNNILDISGFINITKLNNKYKYINYLYSRGFNKIINILENYCYINYLFIKFFNRIIGRDITNTKNRRYMSFKIDSKDNNNTFVLSSDIFINKNNNNNIYIFEGIYDMLSMIELYYNNINNILGISLLNNNISKNLIDYIITNFKNIKNIYFCLDRDINILNKYKNNIKYLISNLDTNTNYYILDYSLYNNNIKDFNNILYYKHKSIKYNKINILDIYK